MLKEPASIDIDKLWYEKLILERGTSWSLGIESLHALKDHVRAGQCTAETGIGYSTLVFAALQAKHHVFYVCEEAQPNLIKYAIQKRIAFDNVQFFLGPSQFTLPNIKLCLDFSLIDGDHGFPTPALDFYYLSTMTKVGGYLMLDDMQIKSVRVVFEFLQRSRHWEMVGVFDYGRSLLIRKKSHSHFDWFGLQEYNNVTLPRLCPILKLA